MRGIFSYARLRNAMLHGVLIGTTAIWTWERPFISNRETIMSFEQQAPLSSKLRDSLEISSNCFKTSRSRFRDLIYGHKSRVFAVHKKKKRETDAAEIASLYANVGKRVAMFFGLKRGQFMKDYDVPRTQPHTRIGSQFVPLENPLKP